LRLGLEHRDRDALIRQGYRGSQANRTGTRHDDTRVVLMRCHANSKGRTWTRPKRTLSQAVTIRRGAKGLMNCVDKYI
jgi:hypothetical protein